VGHATIDGRPRKVPRLQPSHLVHPGSQASTPTAQLRVDEWAAGDEAGGGSHHSVQAGVDAELLEGHGQGHPASQHVPQGGQQMQPPACVWQLVAHLDVVAEQLEPQEVFGRPDEAMGEHLPEAPRR
jgi:hypothetical protein